ncbi:MAG: class II fumarate hydratase [Clostridia bacterium]|nr:class II fumarate hydratase [Clostridia bacterium]
MKDNGNHTVSDSFGSVEVDNSAFWGAQTARSLCNFRIGSEKMPTELIRAIAMIKEAAACANHELRPGAMTAEKKEAIVSVCERILTGELDSQFPLSVWQTGSGTQTNMNVNEVVANLANLEAGRVLLHPNDDVNMSQSTNDVFPSAIHLSALLMIENELIPVLEKLFNSLSTLSVKYRNAVKCGRTHIRDAAEMTFGEEVSGWAGAVSFGIDELRGACDKLRALPLGGTAVGNRINTPERYSVCATKYLTKISGTRVYPASNFFFSMSLKSAVAAAHSALKNLAYDLSKIAGDVRWLSSGPRCGLSVISIPANEPGSSIMPGKVNPTQCEQLIMVCMRVIGNDATVSLAAGSGSFELNTAMPVIAYSFIQSLTLLRDSVRSFGEKCISGLEADVEKMKEYRDGSLMTVTALSPVIGYDRASEVAKYAEKKKISLAEACEQLGICTADEYKKLLKNPDPGAPVRLCGAAYAIRRALPADAEELDRIYSAARRYMKESGNPSQWGDSRPDKKVLERDIKLGNLYIVECGQRAVGAFAFIEGEEPTYGRIWGGSWLSEKPYGTIHRIAGDGTVSGLFDAALCFCLGKTDHIRIDTHRKNLTMLHLLSSRGFSERGIIHLENGDERIAFELILG